MNDVEANSWLQLHPFRLSCTAYSGTMLTNTTSAVYQANSIPEVLAVSMCSLSRGVFLFSKLTATLIGAAVMW